MGTRRAARIDFSTTKRMSEVAAYYIRGYSQSDIANLLGCSKATVAKDVDRLMGEWRESRSKDFDQCVARELAKINHLESLAHEAYARSCEPTYVARTKTEEAVRKSKLTKPSGGDKESGEYGNLREDIDTATSEGECNSQQAEQPKRKRGRPRKVQVSEPAPTPDEGTSDGTELQKVRVTTERTRSDNVGDPRFLDRIAWCIETRLKLLGAFKPDVNLNKTEITINWGDMHKAPTELRQRRLEVVDEVELEIARAAGVVVPDLTLPSAKPNSELPQGHPHGITTLPSGPVNDHEIHQVDQVHEARKGR